MNYSRFRIPCLLIFVATCVLGLTSRDVSGQHRTPTVTASLGVIRNLERDWRRPKYSIYPEIQFSTHLLDIPTPSLAFEGSIYLGGWKESEGHFSNDACVSNAPDAFGCSTTYRRGLALGARLGIRLKKAPANITLLLGLTRHFTWTTVNSLIFSDIRFNRATNLDAFQAIETGLRIQVPVHARIQVGAGLQTYWKIAASEYEINPRIAYLIAASYR